MIVAALGASAGIVPAAFYSGTSGASWFPLIIIAMLILRIVLRTNRKKGRGPNGRNGTAGPMNRPETPPDVNRFDQTYQPPPSNFPHAPTQQGQGSQPGQSGQYNQPQYGQMRPTNPSPTRGGTSEPLSSSFAQQRMDSQAQLKIRLDDLDARRRAGQVDADQYAAERDAIFKSYQ